MLGMTNLSPVALSAYTDLVRLLRDDALSGLEGKPAMEAGPRWREHIENSLRRMEATREVLSGL
jgi:hypothetical protein